MSNYRIRNNTMRKEVWTVLSSDNSGLSVSVFSEYTKAIEYARGLIKEIGGRWIQTTDCKWTNEIDSDIYVEPQEIDRMTGYYDNPTTET